MGTSAPGRELGEILALGYLRLLRQRAAKRQSQADLEPKDPPELTGYRSPLE